MPVQTLSRRQQITRWALALGWTIFLTIQLVQSIRNPFLPHGIPDGEKSLARELFFSGLHLAGFALHTWLWWRAFALRFAPARAIWMAFLFGLTVGLLTETAQYFVPDRGVQPIDYAANILGVLLMVLWLHRRQRRTH